MCMQCETESTGFEKSPIEGFYLCQATKAVPSEKVKEGMWGFVRCNDPEFWWEATPVPDPTFGMTEEQTKVFYDSMTPEQESADEAFLAYMGSVQKCLDTVGAQMGYYICKACIEVGWDIKEGGLASFLCHKIWEASQSKQITHAQEMTEAAQAQRD